MTYFRWRYLFSTPIGVIGLLLECAGHFLGMIAYSIDFGFTEGMSSYWEHTATSAQNRVKSVKGD